MLRFKVEDMSCGHCVATIAGTLTRLDPDAKVDCDLATKIVAVETTLETAAIRAALEDAGYEAEPVAG